MTDLKEFICDKLKELRVSQRSLATASGISRSTIRRFLSGRTQVEMATVEVLMQTLGYTLTPVYTGNPSSLLWKKKSVEPHLPRRDPILPKLIKAAGMEARF